MSEGQALGFDVWTGSASVMGVPHHHGDLEMNLVQSGGVTYLAGGAMLRVSPGRLCAFWGGLPHQLMVVEPGTRVAWATVPLAWVMGWNLPEGTTRLLLGGAVLINPEADPTDGPAFERWSSRLAEDETDDAWRGVVALEVEARFRRFALERPRVLAQAARAGVGRSAQRRPRSADSSDATPDAPLSSHRLAMVESMARYLAMHFREPVRVADVAQHASLHPHYAMAVFREGAGMSIVDYLTRLRVAHAQRLLVTTDRAVLDIALDAGFGSLSRFYEAFRAQVRQAPRAYRKAMRGQTTA